jgi:hypothetical protein
MDFVPKFIFKVVPSCYESLKNKNKSMLYVWGQAMPAILGA